MDDGSINEVIAEIRPLLTSRAPGKIFQLGPLTLAIDFGLRAQGCLLLSIEPSLPRLYLIKRHVRDLERQSVALTQFALALRKELSGTTLLSIEKEAADRIVRLRFEGRDELGRTQQRTVVAQLTGRSANLFLLDDNELIIQRARRTQVRTATHPGIPGQEMGETYRKPSTSGKPRSSKSERRLIEAIHSGRFASASEAADAYFTSLLSERAFDAKASAARALLRKRLSHHQKLLQELQEDLAAHADAEEHKRIGDLLLANVATAKREGTRVTLVDYFAPGLPTIEVEIDEQSTLPEEASRHFARYSRSKRAVTQINTRGEAVRSELNELKLRERNLEEIIEKRDETAFTEFAGAGSGRGLVPPVEVAPRSKQRIPGTRRYISSDDFEILVGRTASDNDHLTFKVAKPNDLWLHTADYGGSHVVVRNPTRKDFPYRTIIEAAQLAAHFSQARRDSKVDVRYTQRKFISKPKGGAPGLVRMSQFKNITVEPKEAIPRAEAR